MEERTVRALEALNARFYADAAGEFSRTREAPWPGWRGLLDLAGLTTAAPPPAHGGTPAAARGVCAVLDAGAGNGRFARAVAGALGPGRRFSYVGLDTSSALLDDARARLEPLARAGRLDALTLATVDVTAPGALAPYPAAALVVAMGLLHHVPGRARREALVAALAAQTDRGGLLAFTAWRFAERPRFRARVAPWSACPTIDPADLEPGDHLLRFGAAGLRYCHHLDDEELAGLERAAAAAAGMERVARYDADGAEGDLNRYVVLARPR